MEPDAYVGSIDLIYTEVFDGVKDTHVPVNIMSFNVLFIEGIPLATLKGLVDVSDYVAIAKISIIESTQLKLSSTETSH